MEFVILRVALSLIVLAASQLDTSGRRSPDGLAALRAADVACAQWRDDEGLAYDASYAGDVSAIECRLALERWGETAFGDRPSPEARLRLNYLHWRVSGERSEAALDAARELDQTVVLYTTVLVEDRLETTPESSMGLDLCVHTNPIQRELMSVARPGREPEHCLKKWGIAPSDER